MSCESDFRAAVPTSDMESVVSDAPVATDETPRFDAPVTIRVISHRKAKHDPDGISAKAVLDAIVRAGILADDSTEQVKSITFESRKSKDEMTEIIIEGE